MNFELSNEIPKPPTVEECHKVINELWENCKLQKTLINDLYKATLAAQTKLSTSHKKACCRFFHSWDNWSKPEPIIINGEKFRGYQQYEKYQEDRLVQKRFCTKCNKMQEKVV